MNNGSTKYTLVVHHDYYARRWAGEPCLVLEKVYEEGTKRCHVPLELAKDKSYDFLDSCCCEPVYAEKGKLQPHTKPEALP